MSVSKNAPRVMRWGLVPLLVTAVGAMGCSSKAPSGPLLQSLTVSSGSLRPEFDPNVTDYELTSISSLYPLAVTAAPGDTTSRISIHGAPAQAGVPVSFKLAPREDFTIVVEGPGSGSQTATPRTYTVHYTPSALPSYSVASLDAARAGEENILLTPGGTHLLIVDRAGAPLYYRTFAPAIVENFQQHRLPNGTVVYSTLVGKGGGTWSLGVNHLMDAQFHDIGDVQLLPNRAHGALPSEGHDFMLLDDQHYVAMSYVQRTVDLSDKNPAWSAQALVMNAVVQEVDHGKVVFEWDSADVPSLYTDSVDGNAFTASAPSDYLHMNSIDIDPSDQNFIFSFRHTSSIVKVDRNTAQIVWTLGGAEDSFGVTADQAFSHQHHARMQSDGTLMVFDNGNNLHQTRILKFGLDAADHEIKSFEVVYGKPADQPQTSFMGSSTQLGDASDGARYLFGWGGWTTVGAGPSVTEVVDGAPVWSLTFTSPTAFSYRALPAALP